MKEKDLYAPIKTLFESLGFQVYGEVNGVDAVATRGEDTIAIELKKDLNLHLIAQGAYRQRLTDHVYIAVPRPSQKVMKGIAYKDKVYLLRRLGIGLIFVATSQEPYHASIILEPNLLDIKACQSQSKRKKIALRNEISGRHMDYNLGGTRGKIMTAYKESAIRVLAAMADGEVHSSKNIRYETGNPKATTILYANHYGWFKRVGQGQYTLSTKGKKAVDEHSHYINLYQGKSESDSI